MTRMMKDRNQLMASADGSRNQLIYINSVICGRIVFAYMYIVSVCVCVCLSVIQLMKTVSELSDRHCEHRMQMSAMMPK